MLSEEDSKLMSWLLYSADSIDMDEFGDTLPPCSLSISQPDSAIESKREQQGELSDLHSENEHLHSDFSSDEHEQHSSSGSNKFPAHHSRKKRQRDDALERRLEELQTENLDLKAHLRNVKQRTTDAYKQRNDMERAMAATLAAIKEGSAADTALDELVVKYRELYADFGSCRQREIHYHLKELEKLLIPTQSTKLWLYASVQGPAFYEPRQSPLFNVLCHELNLSEEQQQRVKSRRQQIQELLHHVRDCLCLINEVRDGIVAKHSSFDLECYRAVDISSPVQRVKFLLWVKKNEDKLAEIFPEYERNSWRDEGNAWRESF